MGQDISSHHNGADDHTDGSDDHMECHRNIPDTDPGNNKGSYPDSLGCYQSGDHDCTWSDPDSNYNGMERD